MKTIKDINLENKKVLIRCDFNVPMKEGKIVDDTRITAALPTIQYALDNNAKVILFSHLGRVKEEADLAKNNLAPVAKRLEELLQNYDVDTFVIGMPYNMNGTKTQRAEVTEKFIHKLNCKFPKIDVVEIDERLTTVAAHKTMNFLDVNKNKKREIVDTISAVYILEMYMNKNK